MQAVIRRTSSDFRKTIMILYLIMVVLLLIIGFIQGYDRDFFTWFDIFYLGGYDSYYHPNEWWFSAEDWFELIFMFGILLSFPFIFSAVCRKVCKNTSLTVSKEQIVGSYSSFLSKKTLQMPIEKIDNLSVSSNLLDKIRTGKTLELRTASGVIKLHFVQNPQEVVNTAMKQIEDIRGKQERARIISQSVASLATASAADKLQELATMKESGLITQEEFEQKRQDILEKM